MFLHGKLPNKLICKTRTYKVKMLLSGWPSSQREDVHQQENDQVLGGRRRLFAWWHWGSTWPFCTYLVSRWQILKNDICILTIRYLNWIGMETKVFNLGDYRRIRCHTFSIQSWKKKIIGKNDSLFSGQYKRPKKVEQDLTKIISFSTTAILKGWKSGKRWGR